MAEVENLLGLITDEETRVKLLAQMEQMFDAAEDEGKLIEQIGSPTKVAVALIRYADKKRAPETVAESVPEQVSEAPVVAEIEEAEANAAAPEEGTMPELAMEEEVPAAPELPEEDAAVPERVEDIAAVGGFVETPEEERTPVDDMAEAFFAENPPAQAEEEFVSVPEVESQEEAAPTVSSREQEEALFAAMQQAAEKSAAATDAAPAVDEALLQAVAAEAEVAFSEVPVDAEPAAAEPEASEKALAEEIFEQAEDAEPQTKTVKVGWKAFLYFLIPGLVPGLPVFLVLFVLSLVFLALGIAAIAFAVTVFMSAFLGFNVVADMLLLIGAGLSIFAVALVLMWFAIWFLTKVCFGWVRWIHRGGVRFSRKEVQVA